MCLVLFVFLFFRRLLNLYTAAAVCCHTSQHPLARFPNLLILQQLSSPYCEPNILNFLSIIPWNLLSFPPSYAWLKPSWRWALWRFVVIVFTFSIWLLLNEINIPCQGFSTGGFSTKKWTTAYFLVSHVGFQGKKKMLTKNICMLTGPVMQVDNKRYTS